MIVLKVLLSVGLASATTVLSADTFTACTNTTTNITTDTFSFRLSKEAKNIVYHVAGRSNITTAIEIQLSVTAYGVEAITRTIDPCQAEYKVEALCPLKSGPFSATGNVVLPSDIWNQIPDIVFRIPDLNGVVHMSMLAAGATLMCLEAPVSNGESLSSRTGQIVTGSIVAGTLFIANGATIVAALSSGSPAGSVNGPVAHSPNLSEMFLWFQTLALHGALSVNYPGVYRSFTGNFGWTMGVISWNTMQESIDWFRSRTGGNLTDSSIQTLATELLVFDSTEGQSGSTASIQFGQDGTRATTTETTSKVTQVVTGIKAFVEQLRVPSENTFMTMLLVLLILLSSIILISILLKAILYLWALSDRFPKRLAKLHNGYWRNITSLLVRIMLVIFGTWSLFCFYQFKNGDSWAATLLAAVTLAVFISAITFFTVHIAQIARRSAAEGEHGLERLYEHTPQLKLYQIFYQNYKFKYWWFFVPALLYSLAKSMFVAFGNGHGLLQVVGCIVCEAVNLLLLFSTHAYQDRKANVVNTAISIVRLLSLLATLVFVDLLNFKETTKTITGLAVIVVQSLLTVALIGLMLFNIVAPLMRKKADKGNAHHEEELRPLEPRPSVDDNRHDILDKDTSYNPARVSVISNESSVNDLVTVRHESAKHMKNVRFSSAE